MISNPAELAALASKPRIDEINLKLLQDFYKTYLNPHRYTYKLEDGFVLSLEFEEKAFCHLVGVESAIQGSVSAKLQANYRGDRGWQGIKNGTIDFAHLKSTGGKTSFNDSKIKFVHFYLLPRILSAPNKFVYYNVVVNRIQCDLMIYDIQENAYIHLGIEKGDNDIYVPRTFLIEKITPQSTGTKFIDPQPAPIAVVRTSITMRNAAPVTTASLALTVPVPAPNQTNTATQSSSNTTSTPTTGP